MFDADLRRRGAAATTRRAYGVDVGQFALWCTAEDVAPREVMPRTVRRYAAALAERRAAGATVGRKLAALSTFFRSLCEHGLIAHNPADLVYAPKPPRHLPRVLAPEELAAVLDRISASTPLEARDRALFELAYGSGLRPEELVALDVSSIDFDGEQLNVADRDAPVPASGPSLRALAHYLDRARPALAAGDGEPALFLSKSGRRLSSSDVRRRMRASARSASVQGGVSPHTLRHSFATHLLEAGAGRGAIGDLLGQTPLSTTRIYTRVESARLKSAYARSHPRA